MTPLAFPGTCMYPHTNIGVHIIENNKNKFYSSLGAGEMVH